MNMRNLGIVGICVAIAVVAKGSWVRSAEPSEASPLPTPVKAFQPPYPLDPASVPPHSPEPTTPAVLPGGLVVTAQPSCDACKPLPFLTGWPSPIRDKWDSCFWVEGEYLYWWFKDGNIAIPLMTQGTTASRGVLDGPGTQIRIGPGLLQNYSPLMGGRMTAGYWIDESHALGLDGSFFLFGRNEIRDSHSARGRASPLLARPFVDAVTGQESSFVVALPDQYRGHFETVSRVTMWGLDANARSLLACVGGWQIDGLAGFRYLDFSEDLRMIAVESVFGNASIPFPGGNTFAPNQEAQEDLFFARTRFYGPQIGFRAKWRWCQLAADGFIKLGLGVSNQSLEVTGRTIQHIRDDGYNVVPGGLLALASNSGNFVRNDIAFVPEIGLNLGFYVGPRIHLFGGWNFLYWSSVYRAADQLDRVVNPRLVPALSEFGLPGGPPRPAPVLRRSDFWAHGVTAGIAFGF
jgi:hypothetical protein